MITILYRRPNEWRVFERAVPPSLARAGMDRCRKATASPWVWCGPNHVANWLLANPEKEEADIPARVLAQAKLDLKSSIKHLQATLDFLMLLDAGIEVPKKRKAKPKKRKAS